MIRKILLTMSLTAAVVTPVAAQESLMTAKEIQDAWVGKTVTGTTATGASVVLMLQNDGTASVTAGKIVDSGTWRLSENGYCATWKIIRAGTERCFTVRKDGSKLVVINPDGSLNSTVSEVK